VLDVGPQLRGPDVGYGPLDDVAALDVPHPVPLHENAPIIGAELVYPTGPLLDTIDLRPRAVEHR